MPTSIKVLPPERLTDGQLSEEEFQCYQTELEVFLELEAKFIPFLKGGNYETWEAGENDVENRLTVKAVETDDLAVKNRDLKLFLSMVAKTLPKSQYGTVMAHATSLEWVYNHIRETYDIQTRGIHVLNILELQYDKSTMKPVGYYNQYRSMVMNNMAQKNQRIKYKGNKVMSANETIGPCFEDIIFINVLTAIDARLPGYIKSTYSHKIDKDQRLMDFKADILVNIPKFLAELEEKEQLSAFKVEQLSAMTAENTSLAAFQTGGPPYRASAHQAGERRGSVRGNYSGGAGTYAARSFPPGGFGRGRGAQGGVRQQSSTKRTFCFTCYDKDKGKSIFNSHNKGDKSCPSGSHLGNVTTEEANSEEGEHQNWEPSQEFAEVGDFDPNMVPPHLHQVPEHQHKPQNLTRPPDNPDLDRSCDCIRCSSPTFSFGRIKAEPTQILTVYLDATNNQPIHIDLDSGANVSFISLAAVRKWGFKMQKCSQLSKLGDGYTTLPSIGEIHETFCRNGWTVIFRALVVEKLHSEVVGGTTFIKDNAIIQDFTRSTISVHDRKHTVMDTKKESLLSISPQTQVIPQIKKQQAQQLKHMQIGERTLLPGQHLHQEVNLPEGEVVLVQGWHENTTDWPGAQLCTVSQGKVEVLNDTREPILIGRKSEVRSLKILQTHEITDLPLESETVDRNYYTFNQLEASTKSGLENIKKISFGPLVEQDIRQLLDAAHVRHQAVFDENLEGGYNHYFGHHECKLNWASDARPSSNKHRAVNYSHSLNGLLQEVCDDLTNQKVMHRPQDIGCNVQCILPIFLHRKQRAKDKPKELLTKDDVRLLANFGPVNALIKDVPTPMTTIDDIFNTLGRFKHIIVFDLYNGFFQNHMAPESYPWLGIMTPFGGLRVMSRSAQGLLGMSEEFSLLIREILKDELKQAKCCQLIDDIIVGGNTQQEAADNYLIILQKLALANLKVAASKTHIFPDKVDVLGWVWKKGGKLEPSPHRRNALVNTKQEDVVTVKDMRSFVGLYKTLRRASPNMAQLMAPLEEAVADKDSKEPFPWNHTLEMRFREAKSAVDNMHTLYLPSPSDKLVMTPDGARVKPGIGHILYAIKGDQKVPVRFHSVKLPAKCERWQPCEIEALAFATGIEADYDLIRESKHPLLICPDSKVVTDAVALIKRGKFSSSARINKFITNVTKVPLEVAHISGKAKLNEGADYQSRAPSQCNSEICSICRFVDEQVNGVIDPASKNAAASVIPIISLGNRQAWRKAQMQDTECRSAISLLKSGKLPSNKIGDSLTTIRRYCREATLAKDAVMVVKEQAKESTGWLARERIVVPQKLLPTLLYQIHHNADNHPTKTQMKLQFERSFYAVELDTHIAQLYNNCYECSLLQRLPKVEKTEESRAEVNHPHQYFHVDVIKRAKQNILLLVDHFSNFQTAKLIPSEKATDLKEGLIVLSEGIRHPGKITVKVDNAKGFESLVKNDQDLQRLNIELVLADVFNKNSNAVVDRACQEIEEELRKLSPEGKPISQATLAQALLQVNKKIRRQGKLSAYEIHAARDGNTGENLTLCDQDIRADHLKGRESARKPATSPPPKVQVGDTVVMQAKQLKHKAREAFVVTGLEDEKVQAQKILHPLTPGKVKIMSKVYNTDAKHVVVTRRAQPLLSIPQQDQKPTSQVTTTTSYDPVNSRFWSVEDESEDDDEVDEPAPVQQDQAGEVAEAAQEVLDGQGGDEDEQEASDADSHAASSGEEADLEDNDVVAEVADPIEDDVQQYDQSRRPKRGEVISYGIEIGTEHERWAEAKITSVSRTPFYYNIRRLDTREELGIYLYHNQAQAWHLGHRQEIERAPLLHPHSRETSPVLLRREEREFRYRFEMESLDEPLQLSTRFSDSTQQ